MSQHHVEILDFVIRYGLAHLGCVAVIVIRKHNQILLARSTKSY